MKLYLLTILFASIVFTSCNNNKDVDQDTMVKVYVDILMAKDTLSHDQNLLKTEKNNILIRYNVKESDYSFTLKKYGDDKEVWDEFFTKAFAYLDTLKKHNKIN